MSDAATFLSALWPLGIPEDSQLILTTQRPGGAVENRTVADLGPLTFSEDEHVWVNVAARRLGTKARGRTEDLTWIPALWADLDVEEGAEGIHRTGNTFATFDDARRFLDTLPVAPSLIVATGYGLSAWWILGEPEPAMAAAPVLAALKATVTRLSDGRTDPAVYDTARMMRLPGTMNVKRPDAPRPCRISSHAEGVRYSLADLAEQLDLPPAPPAHEAAPAVRRSGRGEGRPGDDYDAQATTESVTALLEAQGAIVTKRYEHDGRSVVHLARPGKGRGDVSMTVGYVGPAITHMFSSGWDLLPPDTYRPYRLLAHLEHGGDTLAAVRSLAGQGYGRQLVALDKLPELNGLSVAEDFVGWLDGDALFVEGIGWHTWDGARYVWSVSAGIQRLAQTYAKALLSRARLDIGNATTDEELKAAKATAKKAETWMERTPRVRMLEDVADIIARPASDLDHDPELLNASNGIVNLRTGELIEHDPAYLMTKMAAADYDPQARSADWAKTLTAVTPEVAAWLQVAIGMGATGYASADRIFVAVGDGGNGKTTLLQSARHALGDYGVVIPQKLFTQEGSGQIQALMDLRGARMAVAAETGEDHYLNMERLKALSGGDAITDRHLYATSTVTWTPTHCLWLMTNYRPRVKNSDEGTWRRLTLVPFSANYRTAPDPSLRDRLQADAANRAAILSWLVQGSSRWFADGQKLPACVDVEAATQTWRDEEDGMAGFLGEHYEVTGERGHTIGASVFYEQYRSHCQAAGTGTLSAVNLKKELERYAGRLRNAGQPTFAHGRNSSGQQWFGIKVLSEYDAPHVEPFGVTLTESDGFF